MDWRAALDSVGNVHSTGSLTKLNSTNSAISVNQDFFYSSLQSLWHVVFTGYLTSIGSLAGLPFCIPYFIFHCFLLSPVVPSALLLCWIREQDHPTCVASNQAANQHVPPAFSFVTVMLHDLLCRSTYPHVSFLGRALLPVLHLRSCNVARFDLAGYSPPLLQPLFTSTALAQAPSRNLRSLQF
eukprot:g82365.t1